MKTTIRKHSIIFLGKSLLWAALLFAVVMSISEWDVMKSGISNPGVTIVTGKDTIIGRATRSVKTTVVVGEQSLSRFSAKKNS